MVLLAAQSAVPSPAPLPAPSAIPPAGAVPPPATGRPFSAGERITMKVTYARVLAGRATMSVLPADHEGRPVYHILQEVRSEGLFAWMFRYRVDNRLLSIWDPASGCSYGLDKQLRQGRYVRDVKMRIDPVAGRAEVVTKGPPVTFDVDPCIQDVLSAFYIARIRGLDARGSLSVPVFDRGRRFDVVFKQIGREVLDLPAPLGRGTKTVITEPKVPPGSGLFAQEGVLHVWVTDDARRIPVRARTRVAVGSVSADLESYVPGR